jgi:late competence protein required for DNA uptake (superfamily II DNA/RNA helicase)
MKTVGRCPRCGSEDFSIEVEMLGAEQGTSVYCRNCLKGIMFVRGKECLTNRIKYDQSDILIG